MIELYKFRVRSYDEVKKKCVFRSYEVKLPISSPLSYSHFAEHQSNYIYAYGMALNAGISNPDDFSISQFQTNFNYFYDISFDKYMEPYIKCSEGRQYLR